VYTVFLNDVRRRDYEERRKLTENVRKEEKKYD
jgi:hypothetical protein